MRLYGRLRWECGLFNSLNGVPSEIEEVGRDNRQCHARLAAPTPSVQATLAGSDTEHSSHFTEEKCGGNS